MLEVRALAKATEVVRQAQNIRNGTPDATLVLSMVAMRYRLTRDMKEAAAALKLPLSASALILRQVVADAPGQGTTVWDMGRRGAESAREIDAIFADFIPEASARTGQTVGEGAR